MTDQPIVFKTTGYTVSSLIQYIDLGDIALPDIQRPFVWEASKVRDLFDSMYRGFPIGYLLLWATGEDSPHSKAIGIGSKVHTDPNRLIVDGQQRLTSLYAVLRGKLVIDKNYRETRLEIAFRPRDGRFEVADAAIRKDPEFIADISALWKAGGATRTFVNNFLEGLTAKRGPLDSAEIDRLDRGIQRLAALENYPLTALEIAANVDEEQVADIFVRINSQGTRLDQADFILTLLSVFWEQGREELERFCLAAARPPLPGGPPSPFNHFIEPKPDQLVRVSVALGFDRGRLRSVYQVLRGKDPETDTYVADLRDQQFARLREAQAHMLDLNNWHRFLASLMGAGFRSGQLISSVNALIYTYALYLVGQTRYGVNDHRLQRLIGRWFYMAVLTERYSGSFETQVEQDLSRLRNLAGEDDFVAALDRIIADNLTGDFWSITLPNQLESSGARVASFFAYIAAQNLLGAPVLFSHQKISDLLDPTLNVRKKALDKHHLFPRAWLAKKGITETRRVNQVANFAHLEWPDNIDISDSAPAEYLPTLRARFDSASWDRMVSLHALPVGWELMPYEEFLAQRRKLMALIIRRGFELLAATQQAVPA
jgi:hypothetical protein